MNSESINDDDSFPELTELPQIVEPEIRAAFHAMLKHFAPWPEEILQRARDFVDAPGGSTFSGMHLLPANHDRECDAFLVHNIFTSDAGIISGDVVDLAEKNGVPREGLFEFLSQFEHPSEILGHFRDFEIIQLWRVFADCCQRRIWINAIVQASRRRHDAVKIWLVGKDSLGIGEAILAGLCQLSISVKGMYAFTCVPQDYFILSLRIEREEVRKRCGDVEHFAFELQPVLEATLRSVRPDSRFSIDVQAASQKWQLLRVIGCVATDLFDHSVLEIRREPTPNGRSVAGS